MICPLESEQMDLLLDDAAGRLARRGFDHAALAALTSHMETCTACMAFRRDQKAVWEALDLWQPEPVSADFNRQLWHRIDAAAAAPWYRALAESLRFGWKPLVPLAAAILMIVGGFLLDHPKPAAPGPASGVSVIEADQVEQTLDDIQLLRQLDTVPASGDTKTAM